MNCTTLSLGLILFLTTSDTPREVARVPSADPFLQVDDEDSVAHDVEVMRRLLVKSMGAVRGEPVNDVDDFTRFRVEVSLYSQFVAERQGGQGPPIVVTHSRGFRVPGTGVIYTMDVQVPARAVAEAKAAEPETGVDGADGADEWDAAARDVRGETAKSSAEELVAVRNFAVQTLANRSLGFLGSTVNWELDADALDRVIEAVLGTLARHGTRIGGLLDDESITVALQVTAGSSSYPWRPSAHADEDEEQVQVAVRNYWNLAAVDQVRADLDRTIVIQLSRKNLGELAGSKSAGADIRKRALVHSY